MPAGCDFICKNTLCDQYQNGFVLTAPWPLGRIEIIISHLSNKVAFKPSYQELLSKLIEYKNNGEKHACIIYPNTDNIETVAYRVQLWSPEAKRIYNYDVELNGKSLTDVIEDEKLPTQCLKTGGPLLSFNDVTKDGIVCPFCGEKLTQSRWFTNEN